MRPSLHLLANPVTVGSTKGLKPASLALLPPIPLYRRLFRTHRNHLDPRMRLLGDEYVKSEFRAHRNVENPMHIVRPCPRHWCNSFLSISLGYGHLLTAVSTDWILDRVADVCAED